MAGFRLPEGKALLVASRGSYARHGLYRYVQQDGAWVGTQLGTAEQLSSLCHHPSLPVVYATSRVGMDGEIHAWRLDGDTATLLGEKSSEGAEPCHLTSDPAGRLLIITNYTTSALAVQNLAADGSFDGPLELLNLPGLDKPGTEPDRQDAAHPHQAFFSGETLFVIDLGADLLREYTIDPGKRGAAALVAGRTTELPAGTGPRHGAVLPDGRLAISGELGATIVTGRPGAPASDWAIAKSSTRPGPARTRHLRNYPGDIQRSADGRYAYFANRGNDTISTFDVSGPMPMLVNELDSTVFWPQHLLVTDTHLLVAGWDSSTVVALPLTDGVPGPAEPLFPISGPGWLMLVDA
jgi:6-phosphogluconolactonase